MSKLFKHIFHYGLMSVELTEKHMIISYAGNMGNTDRDVVACVNGLVKANDGKNIPGISVVESVFRKREPSRTDGSPDYWWKEVYTLTKKDWT